MILQVQKLSKSYTIGKEERTVLKDLDLELKKGESIAITGPSGSGKTTLLNMLGLMDQPDSGKIIFKNEDITGYKDQEVLKYRNLNLGFVFQLHHLLPQLTVLENVILPTLAFKQNKAEALDRAKEILQELNIWHLKNNKPSQLSVGESQRTAIARAMINNPEILLADEPTGSLDAENSKILGELLNELNQKGLSIIAVTHSESFASFMQKRYTLKNGQLHQE